MSYLSDYANNVSQILLQRGNAQAQGALQSGQAWANAINGVGQAVAAIPGELQKAKQQQTADQIQQLNLKNLQLELQGKQEASKNSHLLSAAIAASTMGGTLDPQKFTQIATQFGIGDAVPEVLKSYKSIDLLDQQIKNAKMSGQLQSGELENLEMNYFKSLAGPIVAANFDPMIVNAAFTTAQQHGHDVSQWQDLLKSNPDQFRKTLMNVVNPPKLETVAPGASLVQTGGGAAPAPVFTAPKPVEYGQPEKAIVNGKLTFIRAGSDGKTYSLSGQIVPPEAIAAPPTGAADQASADRQAKDVGEIIKGYKDGTTPVILPGRATKEYTALQAEAHRQGFDLSKAVNNFVATQRAITSLNSTQQIRLSENINKAVEMLPRIETMSDQLEQEMKSFSKGKVQAINRGLMTAAKNGAYGDKAKSLAIGLDGQIADFTADMGNVYMGGNAPTDEGLRLASKNLNSDWDSKTLHDSIDRARFNLNLANSARNYLLDKVGVTATQFNPTPQNQPSPSGNFSVTDPNGKVHVFATQAAADQFKKLAGIK